MSKDSKNVVESVTFNVGALAAAFGGVLLLATFMNLYNKTSESGHNVQNIAPNNVVPEQVYDSSQN